ncbi:peptidylprolyl isomerase [Acidocella aquatica]|uniref:Parvulin-like PPIase n=1 Tax=Acidocella aquatica TaxID=1922313 RepID=A0ABQ6ACM1_9PROT|nr:peptidylprolyl isomerase [Acidocella aquatica]GLR68362.1 peptidylprolyl isomerase [Acidocella aquatica]
MRFTTKLSVLALMTSLAAPAAFAQSTPAPAPAATPAPQADPVVASVNGMKIHFSDIQADAQDIPAQMQQMPPNQLFPILVSQEIDRKALLVAAKKEGLEKDPAVAAAMEAAADVKLENAYVQKHIASAVSPAAVQAEYNKDYAGKPGPDQIDARHILVKTQAEAQAIIDQLNKGADFATLAKKDSIDPGAANGGELGWFSQDEMVPAFADAAFALAPGQYTKAPVQTQFGWHVILCEGKRKGPTPALADVQAQIRQTLADNAIKATLADVRSKVKVQVYNADGTAAPQAAPAQ